MSKIPKTPILKQPASQSKIVDANSVQHEDLLKLCWRKLDALVDKLFSPNEEEIHEKKSKEIGEFEAQWNIGAQIARERAAASDNAEIKLHYSRIAQESEAILGKPVAEVEKAVNQAKIEKRTLEREIFAEKGRGFSTRNEVVGFVDIEVEVAIPHSLDLSPSLPRFLEKADASVTSLLRSIAIARQADASREQEPDKVELDRIKDYSPRHPTWTSFNKHATYWIDVRTTPKPIGQLLRELKTLRDFAPEGVIVVMESVGPEELCMLENENFAVLTREILESL